MVKKVKSLLKSQGICEIYTNVEDTDKFVVGYIVGMDDQCFIAESIDQYGKSDGVFCSLLQNIIKLQTSTKYSSNIRKLFEHNNQARYPHLSFKENLLFNLINMIKEKQKICTIELCDSNLNDIIGFIDDIDKESNTIEMRIIDLNGEQDGKATIDIKMISHISVDSTDDIKIETLFTIGQRDVASPRDQIIK